MQVDAAGLENNVTQTQPVALGERLPDLSLLTAAGDEVKLSGLRGEATLLIFLRHLG